MSDSKKEKTMTHTPTPYAPMYEISGESKDSVFITAMENGKRISIGEIYEAKDAAFIIHACNAFPDLVAALNIARDAIIHYAGQDDLAEIRKIDAAKAKAGA